MKLEVRRLTFRDELKGFPPRIAWTLALALFIALKLAHVTDWSWWWVLAPIWIPVLLALVIVALVMAAFILVKWLLMARAWLDFRHTMLPELALADPAILSRIQAERAPASAARSDQASQEAVTSQEAVNGGRDAERAPASAAWSDQASRGDPERSDGALTGEA